MPTVLFVSASLSLLLAADADDADGRPAQAERSRKDVLQLMILHLLKKLPEGEPVALYEFSAERTLCSVAFTDDHSAIRRQIYQMALHEQGPLGPALEKLMDDVGYSFPHRTKIQVVLFSDGRLPHGWDQCRFRPAADDVLAQDSICALVQKLQERYAIHFNAVCLGEQREEPAIKGAYDRLTSAGNGQLCFIQLPGTNVKAHIDDFFDRVFPVFTGSIELGAQTLLTVRADPDPNTVAWDAGLCWPAALAVRGFIAVDQAAYAIISRHSLYAVGSADDSYTRLVLALRRANRVVVVELDRKRHWFAMVRWTAPGALVMDVLEPGAVLPRFQSELAACDFVASSDSAKAPDPSYLGAARDWPSLNPDAVQRDFSKLAKLLQEAETDDPASSSAAITALCDDLRRRADRFRCPSLLTVLIGFLESERAHLGAAVLDPVLARLHHKPARTCR